MRRPLCAGPGSRDVSYRERIVSVASQYRFLELAATEADDQLLGLHVGAEMDLRSIGLLFYLSGSARTVSKALDNLARYSKAANEALVVEVSQDKDEVTLIIRHVEEFDEPAGQYFELIALWFIRALHRQTNRHFNPVRITFTHVRNSDLREVHTCCGALPTSRKR